MHLAQLPARPELPHHRRLIRGHRSPTTCMLFKLGQSAVASQHPRNVRPSALRHPASDPAGVVVKALKLRLSCEDVTLSPLCTTQPYSIIRWLRRLPAREMLHCPHGTGPSKASHSSSDAHIVPSNRTQTGRGDIHVTVAAGTAGVFISIINKPVLSTSPTLIFKPRAPSPVQ